MNRDLIFLGLLLVVVLVLFLRNAQAGGDPSQPKVTTGAYGTRIDYDDAEGRGCCG